MLEVKRSPGNGNGGSPSSSSRRRATIAPLLSLLLILMALAAPVASQTTCGAADSLLTESMYNAIAPSAVSPYTYANFCSAVAAWNAAKVGSPSLLIFEQGTAQQRRNEIAAFLGNVKHESAEFTATRELLICGDNKDVGGVLWCKPCDGANFVYGPNTCSTSLATPNVAFTDPYCDAASAGAGTGCSCPSTIADSEGYVMANDLFFGRGAIQVGYARCVYSPINIYYRPVFLTILNQNPHLCSSRGTTTIYLSRRK